MSEIYLDKAEVLRYLGHKGQKIDNSINKLIDESIREIKTIIEDKYVYKIFNLQRLEDGLLLKNTNLKLEGLSINKHLDNTKSCILLGATLGHKVDTKIRYYEKTNMAKAMILDACASVAIEEILNNISDKLEKNVLENNKKLTYRFSPGYGDLDINIQKDFLRVLGAERSIGLTASSHNILIPRKSVTAIIGIVDKDIKDIEKGCIYCNKYDDCNYTKGDDLYGN